MQKTDEELVEEYVRGREAAFGELTQRYLSTVYSFTVRFVGSPSDAEDITQEIFLKIWKGLKSYDVHTSKFKTWALRIARNAAVDHLRKKKHIPFSQLFVHTDDETDPAAVLAETLPDPGELPDELFARAQNSKLVEAAVATLPPAQREVLLLHYTNHLTFEEIGRTLGESQNTVKSRHHRALISLRKALADEAHAPNLL